jgi:hypothetical protein
MTHETAVHRADAQLTVSGAARQPMAPAIPADVAADGIDEWLTELAAPGDGASDLRAAGLAEGESLHVHAADVPDGMGEWLVTHDPAGITVRRVHEKGSIALRGGASDLVLVLLRRLRPDPGRPAARRPASSAAGWTRQF